MRSAADEMAADELARAARLERMANELLLDAKAIRAKYSKPRRGKGHFDPVAFAKSLNGRG